MQISPRRLPPASALYLDYLDDWPRIQTFFPHQYNLESIAQYARRRPALDGKYLSTLSAALARQQAKFGASKTGVEILAAGGVAVITGQQPGLFTGPHLSILKALSAVKIARCLEESGIRAAPVFWIAAEDHDREEIESTWVLNRDYGLCRARVDLSDAVSAPVGWLQYKKDIVQVIEDCLACLPQSEFAGDIRDLLHSCYVPGKSPVESFGLMMARIFSATPMVFVDPLDPELKRLAQPALTKAVARNSEVRTALLERNRRLVESGYHLQVKVDDNFTGLFTFRGRARQVLKPKELTDNIPLSPNALLRPVVQDSIFPTAAYVGGPAEIAYFAQAAAAYEVLEYPMPPIVPRISATIIESRVARNMEKYGLDLPGALEGTESLKRKCMSAWGGMEEFDRVERNVEEQLESLRGKLGAVDVTLTGALNTSKSKIEHQLKSLRTRYMNAAFRRDKVLERHLNGIENSIAPERKMQERVINATSFLIRNGMGMVRRMDELLDVHSHQHQLIEL